MTINDNFYNLDLEKSILSNLMSIESSYDEISDLINISDFYSQQHQYIFAAITNLTKRNELCNVMMLSDWLSSQNLLESSGGIEYFRDILSQEPTTKFDLLSYAKRLRELTALRQAKQTLLNGEAILMKEGNATDKIKTIVQQLTNIADEKNVMVDAESISQLMPAFFEELENTIANQIPPFIRTGFIDLDSKVGVQAGELVIIAGRPSMGKTTLAQNIIQNIVESESYGIGVFFSLEMPKTQILQRFMASRANVQLSKVISAQGINTKEFDALLDARAKYSTDYNLYIDDRPELTISQMRTTLNRLRNKHSKIGVVLVDYIQIMGDIKGSGAERSTSIGDIANSLKAFSKEFNCPIIAVAQLKRTNEDSGKPSGKPKISDIAESSSIERIADHIWVVHQDQNGDKEPSNDITEIVILKQRQGKRNISVFLNFESEFNRFVDNISQQQTEE